MDDELEICGTGSIRTSQSSLSDRQSSSLGIVPFGFHAKTAFDASNGLVLTRSDTFGLKKSSTEGDIWTRPPPDFRPQLFGPEPVKRNSRDAMQPWKYGTMPGKKDKIIRQRNQSTVLKSVLAGKGSDDAYFVTRFRVPDCYTSKVIFCTNGMYPPGNYETPKPHDFRGYPSIKSLGLPEFETSNEHDPYNLMFKSRHLNTLHGLSYESQTNRDKGQQMAPPLPLQASWESRLILPRSPWPRRPASFTRHRRTGRPPHSAFMDRVEDNLTVQWAKEKLEQTLQGRKENKDKHQEQYKPMHEVDRTLQDRLDSQESEQKSCAS